MELTGNDRVKANKKIMSTACITVSSEGVRSWGFMDCHFSRRLVPQLWHCPISIHEATKVGAQDLTELQECIGSLSISYGLLFKQWPATLVKGSSFSARNGKSVY